MEKHLNETIEKLKALAARCPKQAAVRCPNDQTHQCCCRAIDAQLAALVAQLECKCCCCPDE